MHVVVMCVVCSIFYVHEMGGVDLEKSEPNVGINPIGHPNYVTAYGNIFVGVWKIILNSKAIGTARLSRPNLQGAF